MCSAAGLEGNSMELITAHQMGIYGRELARAARALDDWTVCDGRWAESKTLVLRWLGAEIGEGGLTHSLGKAVRKPLASARGINNDHPIIEGYSQSTNTQWGLRVEERSHYTHPSPPALPSSSRRCRFNLRKENDQFPVCPSVDLKYTLPRHFAGGTYHSPARLLMTSGRRKL